MRENLKRLIPLILISFVPTLLIWIPFIFRLPEFWNIPLTQNGLATIVSNFDGPLYLVVAKSFYSAEYIKANFQFPLPVEYYVAHFPLFPIMIRVLGLLINYPYAMLIVTLASSVLALYFFNKLAKMYVSVNEALFLTTIFAIFPARWLIVRSVGSPEPFFVAAIIASLYYFKNKNFLWAGIWGALAQFTKSPAILLFASYIIYFIWQKKYEWKKYLPILFIPISLVLVFVYYFLATGDPLAYFHSGDNIHLFFPPFQIFNYSAPWVGTFWLEEVIFIYLIGTMGVYKLIAKKEYELASFAGIFFFSTLFVSHRDLMRYVLPIVPFLIIGFSEQLLKKEFKIALAIIVIPIYLFSLAFISQNVMPIANWSPFL